MDTFTRGCGYALLVGGAAVILINLILTPMLPVQAGDVVVRSSQVYLVRLSASLVSALLLLFGCLGLHLAQRRVSGAFGTGAFLATFTGCVLVVAVEWANVFVLRPVAQISPDALRGLDHSALMTAGFGSAVGLFSLGWLLLSVSLWRARVLPRWAALTTGLGLLLIPVLGATPLGAAGAIAGNAVFGTGLIGLGRALVTLDAPR